MKKFDQNRLRIDDFGFLLLFKEVNYTPCIRILFKRNIDFISDEKLTLVDYESNHEGLLQSWRERWSPEEAKEIDSILAELTKRDEKHFAC